MNAFVSIQASYNYSNQANKKTDFTADLGLTWWGSLRLTPVNQIVRLFKYLQVNACNFRFPASPEPPYFIDT